jgi:hypothetical protein
MRSQMSYPAATKRNYTQMTGIIALACRKMMAKGNYLMAKSLFFTERRATASGDQALHQK